MVLSEAPSSLMPSSPLPTAAVPAALVPTRFPCTRLADEPPRSAEAWNQMPLPVLPEMMFSAPATVPPIVLLALEMSTTPWLLDAANDPLALMPTKFPCTRVPVDAWIRIPSPVLSMMWLPAWSTTPPIELPGAPSIFTPSTLLEMSLPSTRLPVAAAPVISTPPPFPVMPLPAPVPPIELPGEFSILTPSSAFCWMVQPDTRLPEVWAPEYGFRSPGCSRRDSTGGCCSSHPSR